MRTLFRIALACVLLVLVLFAVCYGLGARLPVDHTASVTATIAAPPQEVFRRIVDIGSGPAWRPAVKSVQVLPSDAGRDHWIEDLGHGVTMDFRATRTVPPDSAGHALREVYLGDPEYGGSWLYEVEPGTAPGTTEFRITETGYVHPPLYRFMMAYLFGWQRNLNQYVSDMQRATAVSG